MVAIWVIFGYSAVFFFSFFFLLFLSFFFFFFFFYYSMHLTFVHQNDMSGNHSRVRSELYTCPVKEIIQKECVKCTISE